MRYVLILMAVLLCGCQNRPEEPFTAAETLGGVEIPAQVLNDGKRAYAFYCAACHGKDGDGRGPASVGLQTPPRDFRLGIYKFSGVTEGELPPDDALVHLARKGLAGTAMIEWNLSDEMLLTILQYTKTFSAEETGWRDPDMEVGEIAGSAEDPWGGTSPEAVEHGRAVYHGAAGCYSCHPAYESVQELSAHRQAAGKPAVTNPRPKVWLPEPKEGPAYTAPVLGDPTCETEADCGDAHQICRMGRCERKLAIIPPDFLLNQVRNGEEAEAIYRVIAAGIPGTAMPTWKGALPEKDIWGMAHYIKHLIGLKGTVEALALQDRVKASVGGR